MIGIIGALKEEIELFEQAMKKSKKETLLGMEFTKGKIGKQEVVISLCGVGKVNAAMATTVLISVFKPKMIFSTGTAGGIEAEKSTTVIASATVYHDFSIPFEGKRPGQLDEYDFTEIPCSDELCKKAEKIADLSDIPYSIGVIATGDCFVSDKLSKERIKREFKAKACDMESAAIAQVCYKSEIPFLSIRTLSDSANDNGILDYMTFKRQAAQKNSRLILELLKEL